MIPDEALHRHAALGIERADALLFGRMTPLAATGTLYLSVGAMLAAEMVGVAVRPVHRIAAEHLPAHRALLLGTPDDRAR